MKNLFFVFCLLCSKPIFSQTYILVYEFRFLNLDSSKKTQPLYLNGRKTERFDFPPSTFYYVYNDSMAYTYWQDASVRRLKKIQKFKEIGNKPREGHCFIDLINNISYSYSFGLKSKPKLIRYPIDVPKVTYTVMADSTNNGIQEGYFFTWPNNLYMVKMQMGKQSYYIFQHHKFEGLVLEYLNTRTGQYFKLVNAFETQMKIKKPSSKIKIIEFPNKTKTHGNIYKH
ncbi:MAG: hypothetical protein ABS68_04540 [Niastella sp. SCN 39-18]|nr:hypothetical protein [Sphingobacteriales bacterium]ODT53895.1 MAG: hypothetical protein ABS68_04540 [Niastella sp. SCN 39-18]OJW07541.1 MAG: hypothetical protein BGO53_03275 [Sphingobacteriales bacterium 39-19]